MSPLVTYLLVLCLGLFALTLLADLVLGQASRSTLIQLAVLGIVVLVLAVTTGFPTPRRAFGGPSPTAAIGIMFVATMLGIAARYLYYVRSFSWRSFVKPMVLSFIVLLPLIGSVQTASNLEPVQMISLALVAFQSGFFWKAVLEHAETKL